MGLHRTLQYPFPGLNTNQTQAVTFKFLGTEADILIQIYSTECANVNVNVTSSGRQIILHHPM